MRCAHVTAFWGAVRQSALVVIVICALSLCSEENRKSRRTPDPVAVDASARRGEVVARHGSEVAVGVAAVLVDGADLPVEGAASGLGSASTA